MYLFQLKDVRFFVWLQLDGMIVAPTDSDSWGRGLLWWIEFTKLSGITIQGNGVIDGRGSVWWEQDYPTDDDFKLIIPLNNTVQERPPMPVKNRRLLLHLILYIHTRFI